MGSSYYLASLLKILHNASFIYISNLQRENVDKYIFALTIQDRSFLKQKLIDANFIGRQQRLCKQMLYKIHYLESQEIHE